MPGPSDPRPKTRIILADDHAGVLEEIRKLLHREFDVVGSVGDGTALVQEGGRLRPDVVVTDIAMPGLNGIQAGKQLLEANLCKAVLLLSVYIDPGIARFAFDAGIRGYVLKMTAGEELIAAIHEIAAGGTFYSAPLGIGSGG